MMIMANRPVLLGMNVPIEGYLPLDPDGPTGRRLVEIMGRDAFDLYDRTNMIERRQWSREVARDGAMEKIRSLVGRPVVVLGNETWAALSLPICSWLKFIYLNASETYLGDRWYRVPHPSGRNLLYNNERRRSETRSLLREIVNLS